jgi:hypothetical protein
MTNNTNNSDQSETLAQLYEVLLCLEEDIIAIQEKLGISGNANQTEVHRNKKAKTLADSYELLLDLVFDVLPIRDDLGIDANPILEEIFQSNKASTVISLGELYILLLCLEEDIIAIQEKLGIIGYTNQEMAEEADKNARVVPQFLSRMYGNLASEKNIRSLLREMLSSRSTVQEYISESLRNSTVP